jgi:hypothetical protein
LTQDPAKPLDINAIEAALDQLLEHYRQALRAVELLPTYGRVPNREYLVEITPPVGQTRSRRSRSRTPSLPARTRYADWVRSHFAVRSLARMFLRSHIRSKLRAIADHLEVERFASGHMDANTPKRLDDMIIKLRAYYKRLTQRTTLWVRLPGWIWVIAAPVLTTYLGTLVIPSIKITAAAVFVYIATYLLVFVMLVYAPVFYLGALGGFRWKRLILLGQTGDVNIDITTNAVLRWVPAPQENTYESENRFFSTLGLPKSDEFPWDLVLAPHRLLLAALALSFFLLALAFAISTMELGWPILIAVGLLVAFFFCLRSILRPIFRAMRERRLRSAC